MIVVKSRGQIEHLGIVFWSMLAKPSHLLRVAKAQATARVAVPTTLLLSVSTVVVLERAPYVLMFGDDEDETHPHLSQRSARASGRRRACDMDGNSTSVFSAVPPSVSQLKPSIFCISNGSSLVVRVHRRQLGLNGTTRKKTSLLSCGTTRQPSSRWSGGHQP